MHVADSRLELGLLRGKGVPKPGAGSQAGRGTRTNAERAGGETQLCSFYRHDSGEETEYDADGGCKDKTSDPARG